MKNVQNGKYVFWKIQSRPKSLISGWKDCSFRQSFMLKHSRFEAIFGEGMVLLDEPVSLTQNGGQVILDAIRQMNRKREYRLVRVEMKIKNVVVKESCVS